MLMLTLHPTYAVVMLLGMIEQPPFPIVSSSFSRLRLRSGFANLLGTSQTTRNETSMDMQLPEVASGAVLATVAGGEDTNWSSSALGRIRRTDDCGRRAPRATFRQPRVLPVCGCASTKFSHTQLFPSKELNAFSRCYS